jgi:putative component of toxin-antitoxin plasmid stabilization module
MDILIYPDLTDAEDGSGPVRRELVKLKKCDPQLWNTVCATLKKAEESPDLEDLRRQKWVGRLSNVDEPIHEFRIPPTRGKGVFRIYFAYKKNCATSIVLLAAEYKQGKSEADHDKIEQACKRYREQMK